MFAPGAREKQCGGARGPFIRRVCPRACREQHEGHKSADQPRSQASWVAMRFLSYATYRRQNSLGQRFLISLPVLLGCCKNQIVYLSKGTGLCWKVKVASDSLRPHGLYSLQNSPGQATGVGSRSLLQGIFPIQGSNSGFPNFRQTLYHLSHKGSPGILEWVDYPFSRGSSEPRNQTRVSWIAGGFFTNWAIREALAYIGEGGVNKY